MIVSVSIAAWALIEFAMGRWQSIAEIREQARLFREEVAPLRISTHTFIPELDHRYPENEGQSLRRLRTNGLGTIIGPGAPGRQFQILFLGGSTTECNEVNEELRFPAVVERILNDAGLGVTALNAGVRGHTSMDSINALLNRSHFRNANVIVMMHNINDRLWLAHRGHYGSDLSLDAPTTARSVLASTLQLASSLWDYISYRSNVFFAIRSTRSQFDPWIGESASVPVDEDAIDLGTNSTNAHLPLFRENLRLFVQIVRAIDARPVLMTQPLGVVSAAQTTFNDSIREVATELDVPLIDVDQRLGSDNAWAFFGDGIHLNNEGSAAAGGIIADEMGRLLGASISAPVGIRRPSWVDASDLIASCGDPDKEFEFTSPQRILEEPGRYPSFSTDGKWLLFQSRDGNRDIVKAWNLESRQLVELSSKAGQNERHPTFLDVGNEEFEIVFGAGFDEERREAPERLMVRTWPAMAERPLLADPRMSGSIPARGLSGLVAFAGWRETATEKAPDLYIVDKSIAQLRRITDTPWEEWRPAVGPDGSIYFIANPAGNFDIFRIRPGYESEPFIDSPVDEWDPAISPDGRWLAFASRKTDNWDIFLAPSDRSQDAIRVTDGPNDEWDPSWHPSGRSLAYAAAGPAGSKIMGLCLWGTGPR